LNDSGIWDYIPIFNSIKYYISGINNCLSKWADQEQNLDDQNTSRNWELAGTKPIGRAPGNKPVIANLFNIIVPTPLCSTRIKFTQFVQLHDMAVDHVDDFQFALMQFIGGRGAAVIDDDHIEAFVGQAAHC